MFNKKQIFHKVLAKASHNTLQLRQICDDSQLEIKHHQRTKFECAEFIDRYYNIGLGYGELVSLGRFISNGEHTKELNLYL
jgi:hypothetical protein